AGNEANRKILPAEKPKKVLVIGGGPAGMETARVAAIRGHNVTLYESNDRLGGQMLVASVPPHKEDISRFNKYLARQVEKVGVKVKLNHKVSAETVEEEKPDVVVIATGARSYLPAVPGIKGSNVVTVVDLLSGRKEVGDRVIIVGAGMEGCEVAEYLAAWDKKVTILSRREDIVEASDSEALGINSEFVQRLKEAGVRLEVGVEIVEITTEGVKANREGVSVFFETDTVVIARGMEPNSEMTKELDGKVSVVHQIGDCVKARRIVDAVHEGSHVGREL
ncbi:FAD-dependent oxidoreductase, partial [Chloroflexota bacterium]